MHTNRDKLHDGFNVAHAHASQTDKQTDSCRLDGLSELLLGRGEILRAHNEPNLAHGEILVLPLGQAVRLLKAHSGTLRVDVSKAVGYEASYTLSVYLCKDDKLTLFGLSSSAACEMRLRSSARNRQNANGCCLLARHIQPAHSIYLANTKARAPPLLQRVPWCCGRPLRSSERGGRHTTPLTGKEEQRGGLAPCFRPSLGFLNFQRTSGGCSFPPHHAMLAQLALAALVSLTHGTLRAGGLLHASSLP